MNIQQVITCPSLCLLSLIGLTLFASPADAQVFDLGPSASSSFDSVINLPSDPNIGNSQSIGGDGLTTQLNIAAGGTVGFSFDADSGSEVNLSGGVLGGGPSANAGSEINVNGGTVLTGLTANSGGVVNVSAGSAGPNFDARFGSVVNISGGSLGARFTAENGSDVNISGGTVGPSFQADAGSDVELIGGEFQLNGTAFSDPTISLAPDDIFTGTLTDGSTFIFENDGSFFNSDSLSNVNLTSGPLPSLDLTPEFLSTVNPIRPSGLRAGQELTLQSGGALSANFESVSATLNVDGGILGSDAGATDSVVNISGGSVGFDFNVLSGSEVNISGGAVGIGFNATNSEVNISGGTVASAFAADSGSVVNISGGSVGIDFFALADSEVNISGGSVDEFFFADTDSVVNISGGSVGFAFQAYSGSEVNISGGTVDEFFFANSGSVVNISGGSVDEFFFAGSDSEVNISGGIVGDNFEAESGSFINLIGSDFLLDGVSLNNSLTIDSPFQIFDRDMILSGVLADGSVFSFDLNSALIPDADFFASDATLTVTLVSAVTVPEPGSLTILGLGCAIGLTRRRKFVTA